MQDTSLFTEPTRTGWPEMAASEIDRLALFGGAPAFADTLHVGRPNIGNRERLLARINDILDRKWLSNSGPYVQEFQQRVADLLGVKHCIAVCNGAMGLEIATRAAGLSGEVIVPSFTFAATAHALQWQEITPVFCDVDPQTHTLNPALVESMITPRTTGIIGVHLWGRPCAVEALAAIAQKHNLRLIFDAAHAFGVSHRGRMIGNFGCAEVFSFHATKFLNTFEGGAIVTNDDALAEKIRLMQNFGFSGYDQVIYIGTNGKMNEVAAAMGLTGLESMGEFVALNYCNYKHYQRELADLPGIRLLPYNEAEKNNYQYIVLEIDETITGITRDQLMEVLWAENVRARRYFYPGCHRMEPYRSYFPHAGLLLHETERLTRRVLVLPTGTSIAPDDISKICWIIRLVITNSEQIRERLAQSAR
jgi:dTDP-4-amino-4,6-dideoxygalactose transaminase